MAKQPSDIDVRDREQLEAALRDVAQREGGYSQVVALAARAALRAVPAFATLNFSHGSDHAATVLLPALRGIAASWVAASFPSHDATRACYTANASSISFDVSLSSASRAAAMAARYAAGAAYTGVTETSAADRVSRTTEATTHAFDLAARTADALDTAFDPSALTADFHAIQSGERIAIRPLWPIGEPEWVRPNWRTLRDFLSTVENWWVWRRWYEARLRGGDVYPELSAATNERIEVARVLEIEEEDWEQGPAHVNALIKAIIDRETERDLEEQIEAKKISDPARLRQDEAVNQERLPNAEFSFSEQEMDVLNALRQSASPTVGKAANQQLDAQPNRQTDVATDTALLIGLPERQCTVIATILSDLPKNTPKHLRTSLEQYSDHLKERRFQPIVGLLDDQSKIIKKAVGSGDAAAWLEDGQKEAFRLFHANHRTMKQAFPLSAEREETFASTPLNEDAITLEAVKPIVDKLDEAVDEAHRAGAVSDDYQITSHQLTDNLRLAAAEHPAPEVVATEADRFEVSTKRRATFSSISYYYETYRLASTISSDPAIALASVMAWALRELLKFAGI